MGRTLYVGNFLYETGEAELQNLFARAGTVETVKVMRDMARGRPRGFAFVEMSSDDEAHKAIVELNEYQLALARLLEDRAIPDSAPGKNHSGAGPCRKHVLTPAVDRSPPRGVHRRVVAQSVWASGGRRRVNNNTEPREQKSHDRNH